VCVFSQDFTVFGGSLGEVMGEKMCKIMDLAAKIGCPVIGINDSGGARIQEGVVSLGAYGDVFVRNVRCSGVIPQISLIMGPCAGGAVYSPAITDFIFMVKETSHMFITGPDVIKTVTGEEVGFEELGGAMSHNTKSGVAHFASEDEDACLEDCRYLIGFLPQNNLQTAPRVQPTDDPQRMDPELDHVVPDNPNKPYDMRNVVRLIVDDQEFFEVHEHHAKNIICGFARLDGFAVGIVGNQPAQLAGVLDIDASAKAALVPYVKSLARNLAAKNVRANMVSPGTVYFKGGVWDITEQKRPEIYKAALARNPMGRMGTPQEVANAAVFLASPRASFISGTNLIVDGALTQRVQY